jgi:uncharacterized protein YecE (DUF72 family)
VGDIRIGCSGWNYQHWRNGVLYPPRLPAREWLSYYAARFGTVEVNSTFYRLPKASAVSGWVEQTPPDFVIAAKASRYLTHVKQLRELPEHLALLLDRLRPLVDSPKLGPLLWQLPPTFRKNRDRLEQALAQLPREIRHAFEFRHVSWFDEEVFDLLRDHSVAFVIADRAGAPAVTRYELTAGFTYVRFHRGQGPDGAYTSVELERWRERLSGWAKDGDVFAYFNNDQRGFAIDNALELRTDLGQE